MRLDNFYKDGFVLSPYYRKDDIKKYIEVKTKVLTKEDIRTIVMGTSDERSNLLFSDEELILVKYFSRYHVRPLDLVEKFEKEISKNEPIAYHTFLKNIDVNWIKFGLSNVIEHKGKQNELFLYWCL